MSASDIIYHQRRASEAREAAAAARDPAVRAAHRAMAVEYERRSALKSLATVEPV